MIFSNFPRRLFIFIMLFLVTASVYCCDGYLLLKNAGEVDDDLLRYELLKSSVLCGNLSRSTRNEIEGLLPKARQWAVNRLPNERDRVRSGSLSWFIAPWHLDFANYNKNYPAPDVKSSVYPLWALYRARELVQVAIQWSTILMVKNKREYYFEEARSLFKVVSDAFPNNKLASLYFGDSRFCWPVNYEKSSYAPEWANSQRKLIEQLSDVIEWWIDNRQDDINGFGGGLEDDVEMWRWWAPILLGFNSKKIIGSQERLARLIFSLPQMRRGYSKRIDDVEHASELSTDTLLPMLLLQKNEPWHDYVRKQHDSFFNVSTGLNRDGKRHFKSIRFGSDDFDLNADFAFDTPYHFYALKPQMLSWLTIDSDSGVLIQDWLRSWVYASINSYGGKPKGLPPAIIRWPDGVYNSSNPWYRPFSLEKNEALYNWPAGVKELFVAFLLAWNKTGDDYYLLPYINSKNYLAVKCAADDSDCRFLHDKLADIFVDVDHVFDSLNGVDNKKWFLSSYVNYVSDEFFVAAETMNEYWPFFTHEARWTDRVIDIENNFLRFQNKGYQKRSRSFELLYSSLTGDPSSLLGMLPPSVRWLIDPRDVAAIVFNKNKYSVNFAFFNFAVDDKNIDVQLRNLEKGSYSVTEDSESKGACGYFSRKIIISDDVSVFSFTAKSRRECVIRIERS